MRTGVVAEWPVCWCGVRCRSTLRRQNAIKKHYVTWDSNKTWNTRQAAWGPHWGGSGVVGVLVRREAQRRRKDAVQEEDAHEGERDEEGGQRETVQPNVVLRRQRVRADVHDACAAQ